MRATIVLFCLLACLNQPVAAQALHQALEIPLVPRAGARALKALLYLPPSAPPYPAVLMLHGCGGAYARSGAPTARHHGWGEYLASQGYAALLLDSFSTRGLTELCTVPHTQRTLKERDRVDDAYAALGYLHQRPDIRPTQVAVLGWSHGAGVVLDTIARAPRPTPAFQAAVAFYPGCTARAQHAHRFHPYAPLLLLIGEDDDWTPAAPCQALTASVAARGEPMDIVSYPGTFHDFDNPALSGVRVRQDVPNGVHPGAGVTTAPNPQAHADAQVRVLRFLQAHLH